MSFTSLIHPDDGPIVRQQRAAALERNQSYEIEYGRLWRDGLLRWIGDASRGGPGHATEPLVEGVMLRCIARKLADLAARESERRYRGLFDHAIEGIFRTTVKAATWKPTRH